MHVERELKGGPQQPALIRVNGHVFPPLAAACKMSW
jgi:hypothetical protein